MDRASKEDRSFFSLKDQAEGMDAAVQEKGYEHEDAFYQSLIKDTTKSAINIEEKTGKSNPELAIKKTIEAMKDGIDIIFQGCLAIDQFRGYSDFLIKVPGHSDLGDYHYEVWDTKLSKSVKPHFIIQLCAYAEMLEAIQGVKPKEVSVVLGTNERIPFKTSDYFHSYLALKNKFLDFHSRFDLSKPEDPANSKDWRDWSSYAKQLLEEQDHLSFVANISRTQIKKFNANGITTLTQLAQTSENSIPKMRTEVFEKLKSQAQIQLHSAGKDIPDFKVLEHGQEVIKGLELLPPHNDADVFFDIEGDPLVEGGLEYLWGVTFFVEKGERDFIDFWAHDADQEKKSFEEFVLWVYKRWKENPGMHIYHYANYEIAACRRLMGRYAVCEEEVNELLRNNVFIDLYKVVKHGLLIGERNYSIKSVEHIYRGKRDTEVANGGESVVVYENWRDKPDGSTWQDSKVLKDIRDYNKDDCDSTQELVDWLRGVQADNNIGYVDPTANKEIKEPEQKKIDFDEKKNELLKQLLDRSTQLKDGDLKEAAICELFANLLHFHEREARPTWWKLFERLGMDESELYDDLECIAYAHQISDEPFKASTRDKNLSLEYQVDVEQEFKIPSLGKSGKNYYVLGVKDQKVTMTKFDVNTGRFTVKFKDYPGSTITLVPDEFVNPVPIPQAIVKVIEEYLDNPTKQSALLDFLRRSAEQSKDHLVEIASIDDPMARLSEVIRVCGNLDNSFIAIQGPPGAGKSFTGKHIILDLLRKGKRIGVSSNSHKAIGNLLEAVAKEAVDQGVVFPIYHTNGKDSETLEQLGIQLTSNAKIKDVLEEHEALVVGTTAWGFARDDVSDRFDYLFIDEAGQVSLANLVAMSQSTENLILLGDQMQLGQPLQGSHPGESGLSVLEYLLGEHHTIPNDLGVFLGVTFRMHSKVNQFVSDAFYDGRLTSADQCDNQKIDFGSEVNPDLTKQTGIIHISIEHEGNSQASEEEAEKIAELAQFVLGKTFIDSNGKKRTIGWDDMLFIAPYNHQVTVLKKQLGEQAKVGSVDLFQGQEAPVVFISMCSSQADDSARGLEFLLDPNRLNVAISRAQALAVVVSSETLTDVDFTSLKSVMLANNFEMLSNYSLS
jgi:uncharacterized protein